MVKSNTFSRQWTVLYKHGAAAPWHRWPRRSKTASQRQIPKPIQYKSIHCLSAGQDSDRCWCLWMFSARKCSLADPPKMEHSDTNRSLCSLQLPFARKSSASSDQASRKCLTKIPHMCSSSTPVSDNISSLPIFYQECSEKHHLINACVVESLPLRHCPTEPHRVHTSD